MTNVDIDDTTLTLSAERDWEDELNKESAYEKPDTEEYQKQPELNFVETDIDENPTGSQRHRSIPPKGHPKSITREKSTSPTARKSSLANKTPPQLKKQHSPKLNTNAKKSSEEPDLDGNVEKNYNNEPKIKLSNAKVEKPKSPLSRQQDSDSTLFHRLAEKDVASDVAPDTHTALTFGETKDIFEQLKHSEKLSYETNTVNEPDKKSTVANEVLETDIFLHNFIRHEPPSTDALQPPAVLQPGMNDIFSLSHQAQHHFTQVAKAEQQSPVEGFSSVLSPPGIHVLNGRDSISSGSGSSLISPLGSLENDFVSNVGCGVPMPIPSQIGNVPLAYPFSIDNQERLRRHLEEMQYASYTRDQPSQTSQAQNVFSQFVQAQYSPLSQTTPQIPNIHQSIYQQQWLDTHQQQMLQVQQQLQQNLLQAQQQQSVQQQLNHAQQQSVQQIQHQQLQSAQPQLNQVQQQNVQQIQHQQLQPPQQQLNLVQQNNLQQIPQQIVQTAQHQLNKAQPTNLQQIPQQNVQQIQHQLLQPPQQQLNLVQQTNLQQIPQQIVQPSQQQLNQVQQTNLQQIPHNVQTTQLQQVQQQLLQMSSAFMPQIAYNGACIQQPSSSNITDKPENYNSTQHGQPLSLATPQVPSSQPYGFAPNQFQPVPTDTFTPKQEEMQQQMLQGLKIQSGDLSKELQGLKIQLGSLSKEDLELKYLEALQTMSQLQEKMQQSSHQLAPANLSSPVMPYPAHQLYQMGIHAQVLQQASIPNHTLPVKPHDPISLDRNTAQEPMVASVGRGRGRLLP